MIYEIILTLFIGIFSGFLIAYLCKDEIVKIRNLTSWFVIITILFGIGMFLAGLGNAGYTLITISIISLISYIKSFDRKWTKV
ncbi:MAG: hypothetical protein AABW80_02680 [Nanoarchaeota archaeon]